MKKGTRIIVKDSLAKTWGFQTPATGIITGPDPCGNNTKVFAVKLDQGVSLFEVKGVHKERMEAI